MRMSPYRVPATAITGSSSDPSLQRLHGDRNTWPPIIWVQLKGQQMTSKSVTRVGLYEAVYRKVGLSRSQSLAMLELVLKKITASLERAETVKLSSLRP